MTKDSAIFSPNHAPQKVKHNCAQKCIWFWNHTHCICKHFI